MAKNQWIIWKEELYRVTEDGSMFEGKMSLSTDEKGALHIV
jgi:N-acetylmuramoyl-L-alanine amidase